LATAFPAVPGGAEELSAAVGSFNGGAGGACAEPDDFFMAAVAACNFVITSVLGSLGIRCSFCLDLNCYRFFHPRATVRSLPLHQQSTRLASNRSSEIPARSAAEMSLPCQLPPT
jgi:hypothetical protein